MKINDSNKILRPHLQSQNSQTNVGKVSGQKVGGPSGALTSIETSSVESLYALMGNTAEVRDSLVQEIKLKVEAGEYLTQKAAVETADAILNL
jgi:anti-sigma28 factor (negative regulator of flagellin synthesis)